MKQRIRIAVKVNGGYGTVLVRANYLHCLYEYINDENIEIYAYAHKFDAINDAIFLGQPSITYYGNESEWNSIKYEDYDLVFVLDIFPDIKFLNYENIEKNENLKTLVTVWNNFKEDSKNQLYFRNLRESKPYIYTRLMIQGKTVLNSADIDDILGIEDEYTMTQIIQKNETEILENFGLKNKKFITIQRGINPKLVTPETPKMWPVSYYKELIKTLKEKHPEYVIVQLGEDAEHCKTLEGVDISLVGKTDWDDLKILLKNAYLHIDGECGMVHLRKSLHAGPSVVIFGSTPIDFFGYTGNINIVSNVCGHWCAELREDWEYHCLKDTEKTPCMYAITPQKVFTEIEKYINGDTSGITTKSTFGGDETVIQEIIDKHSNRIDKQYTEEWLCKEPVYGYEIIEVPVNKLKAHVLFGKESKILPVKKIPAFQYLTGNKKAYIKNMEIRNENLDNNLYSVERFEKLIESLDKLTNPEDMKLVVIDSNNLIKDGQHRAAWWMKKYGESSLIPVLKIYKPIPACERDRY